MFILRWSVYFDDYIGVETEALSKIYDLCVEGLFALLGWETAEEEELTATIASVLEQGFLSRKDGERLRRIQFAENQIV